MSYTDKKNKKVTHSNASGPQIQPQIRTCFFKNRSLSSIILKMGNLFQKKRNFYLNSGVYINEDAKNKKNPLFYPSFFHGISNG